MSSKRVVEAFGADGGTVSAGAVTTGDVPSRGKQSDATPHKNGGVASSEGRPVRAFGDLPAGKLGGLQQDMDRGSPAARQYASTDEVGRDLGGVNSSGRTLKAVDPYFVKSFQGRSGEPDNQSTSRGKGST